MQDPICFHPFQGRPLFGLIQVLDRESGKWSGVIVFDRMQMTGHFVSYQREFREFDAVRYTGTENWTEIQYIRNNRIIGIVYIRKPR